MPRSSPNGLQQSRVRAKEAFSVGIQDTNQRHLGEVQALVPPAGAGGDSTRRRITVLAAIKL